MPEKNPFAIVKPKLNLSEKKIIAFVIDRLPNEKSRRAYRRALK
jgi:hypothetical protein